MEPAAQRTRPTSPRWPRATGFRRPCMWPQSWILRTDWSPARRRRNWRPSAAHSAVPLSLAAGAGQLGRLCRGGDERFQADAAGRAAPLRCRESKRAMVLMTGEEQYRAWGELLYSVHDRKEGFDRVFGTAALRLSGPAARASLFDAAMVSIHGHETPAMLAAYDFSGLGTLADFGGGNAQRPDRDFASSIRGCAASCSTCRTSSLGPSRTVAAAGLADRCQAIGGSFFETRRARPMPT